MRDDLEGSWPGIRREVKSTRTRAVGEGQPGKTAKRRTRRSQKKKWRTSRMTMTEKDLEEDGNKDERVSERKGRGIK